MKNFTLTSIFIFCFAFNGFGQWEQVDIPNSIYQISGISVFKDKLLTQNGAQYYISDKDSIHWTPYDFEHSIICITPDSVIAKSSAVASPTLHTSTDLINWKTYSPGLYKITNMVNVFGEINMVSHNGFYRLFKGRLERDTTIEYFQSSDGFTRYDGGEFNNRSRMVVSFYGKRDSLSTVNETTIFASTGDQFNWLNINKDKDIVKTPDGKKFVVEYSGKLKERLRHDKFRYLWNDTRHAEQFIRNGTEIVLIGKDTARQKHFAAQYSSDQEWQIVFESDEEIPFKLLDENYLYGTDSSAFFYLDLNNGNFTILPFSDSIGNRNYIRRAGGSFFLTGEKGILRLNNDGIWAPVNSGLPKIAYNVLFNYDESSNTLFNHQYNSNNVENDMYYSEDEGDSWHHVSLPGEINLATNLKKIFKKGDSLLICAGSAAYLYMPSVDELIVHKFRGGSSSNRTAAFRKGNTIAYIIPYAKSCFISEDFGVSWDTVQINDLDYNTYGVHLFAKGDTLSFKATGAHFYYSPDFGRSWKEFQDSTLLSARLVGIGKGEEIFYLKDSTYTHTWPNPTYMSLYTKRLNGKIETERSITNLDKGYFDNAAYHAGSLYFSLYNVGVFKKEGTSLLRDPIFKEGSPFRSNPNSSVLGFSDKHVFSVIGNHRGLYRKKR